jgi:hypothetical protein
LGGVGVKVGGFAVVAGRFGEVGVAAGESVSVERSEGWEALAEAGGESEISRRIPEVRRHRPSHSPASRQPNPRTRNRVPDALHHRNDWSTRVGRVPEFDTRQEFTRGTVAGTIDGAAG